MMSTAFWISYAVLWLMVLLQIALTIALARLVGQLNQRLPPSGARLIDPGPEIGDLVEAFDCTDLQSHPVSFYFPSDHGLLVLYISPHCSACTKLLPAFRRFSVEISQKAAAAIVMVQGSPESQKEYVHRHKLTDFTVLSEEEIPPSLHVGGAPYGLWVDRDGHVVAKGMVNNREHLESLMHASDRGHASLESYMEAEAGAEED
jgi:methylamine dehydrogenase accessory protein MauD